MGVTDILESWKAIASYLGRTEKTCRKWERELGLPVHRLDDSPKVHVFAYPEELDRWRKEKLEIVEICGEIEFRMVEGSDEFIQLEALLARVANPRS